MDYMAAVLRTLSDLGIVETDLSSPDFSVIAEWQKQGIPIDFLVDRLRARIRDTDRRPGAVSRLETAIIDDFVDQISDSDKNFAASVG